MADKKRVLQKHDRNSAIATLLENAGWVHMLDYYEELAEKYQRDLLKVSPDEHFKIAALQARIELLHKIKRKPQLAAKNIEEVGK